MLKYVGSRPGCGGANSFFWMLGSLFLLGILFLNGVSYSQTTPLQTAAVQTRLVPPATPAQYKVRVLESLPHDNRTFTEGLLFDGDVLVESSGLYQVSYIRRYDLRSGEVFKQISIPGNLFAEGIALLNRQLIMLTYQENIAYVYAADTLAQKTTFRYQHEGWGATSDGKELIVSDGTDILRFYSPKTAKVVRQVRVRSAGKAVSQLNELEWIEGKIWANVFGTTRIVQINPQNGEVLAWIDASSLPAQANRQAVLNGIAYHAPSRAIYLTGKYYSGIYSIALEAR